MNYPPDYVKMGTEKSKIDVRISYRIIQLFSEGLYSSPHKAIEELVSNSYDAGATKVHVIISPQLTSTDSTIAVIDNGTGMDEDGLRQHWLIGVSNKRENERVSPKGRKQIGKFGIGKLSTYVLSNRLTHICKSKGKYFSTSMDYHKIPSGEGGGIYTEDVVQLPLRVLTVEEASKALLPWLKGEKPGYKNILLFNKGASENWTAAIMSDLKDMATEIQIGRLRWLLGTAMPLRDDFELYLNGEKIIPSKIRKINRVGHWIIGKNLKELPKPAPDELQVTEDPLEPSTSIKYFGLTHPQLGRVTGYIEIYEDLLTTGKSSEIDRSHGFFVYVNDRLVNINDEYFRIDRNLLRHGTFSRFRMVVNIDKLDDELRSSRESLREGSLLNIARNILHGGFNYARYKLEDYEKEISPLTKTAKRIADTPHSLARRPLLALATKAIEGKISPKLISYPRNVPKDKWASIVEELKSRANSEEGLIRETKLENISTDEGVAILDIESGVLKINSLHPFVAYFLDAYEDKKQNLPLELYAASEILLEAQLYESNLEEGTINDLMESRDDLLRFLAKSAGKRNALMISHDLIDASTNKDLLERELVSAFESMGFEAIPIGGKGKPDGLAEAHLSALKTGDPRSYKISLEAKSKIVKNGTISAEKVNVSAIARHRDDFNCDHAVVVGPNFPTAAGDVSALVKEITADNTSTKKTITLIRISDLARLVRLVPLKRLGLNRLRELFSTCKTPEESKSWIDLIESEKPKKEPYKKLLDIISEEQREGAAQPVSFGSISTAFRFKYQMIKDISEIGQLCFALSKMAPEYVNLRGETVELNQRPDIVLETIRATIRDYPDEEQKESSF